MLWKPPASFPSLNPNEVHLWCMNLQISEFLAQNFTNTLSKDEISKANRFRFDYLTRRYIGARGMLRHLLGQYLTIEPSQICFKYGKKGKPSLDLPNFSEPISFNLSHSEEMSVFAFSYGGDVGIDIEKVREMTDVEAIAKRFFCPEEGSLIAGLTGKEQLTAFFELWTAKEAYLKATGDGIGAGLDSIRILWQEGQIQGLSLVNESVTLPNLAGFTSFTLAEDYIGAAVNFGKKCQFLAFTADGR
ncbi:MAG: 4'-phosphopantetheinyl transferase superfamily protein [Microcystaceae cyanobacterium]